MIRKAQPLRPPSPAPRAPKVIPARASGLSRLPVTAADRPDGRAAFQGRTPPSRKEDPVEGQVGTLHSVRDPAQPCSPGGPGVPAAGRWAEGGPPHSRVPGCHDQAAGKWQMLTPPTRPSHWAPTSTLYSPTPCGGLVRWERGGRERQEPAPPPRPVGQWQDPRAPAEQALQASGQRDRLGLGGSGGLDGTPAPATPAAQRPPLLLRPVPARVPWAWGEGTGSPWQKRVLRPRLLPATEQRAGRGVSTSGPGAGALLRLWGPAGAVSSVARHSD